VFGVASLLACGGTTVFDAPDPDACATGHGCPMAVCACTDGSIILDTTCEKGSCLPSEKVCPERCQPYGGAARSFATANDEVPIPACDTFCARLDANGCELGCDTLFSQCLTPGQCDAGAAAFWKCVVTEGVMTCEDNYVRVEGCDGTSMGLCEPKI
jgi:hypothetical protein